MPRSGMPMLALLLLPVLSGCLDQGPEVRVRAGDLVVLDLQAWDAQGREVRSMSLLHAVNGEHVPVRLPAGWEPNTTEVLPPGARAVLAGARAGEERSTGLLPPEQAYGPWRDDLTIAAPRRQELPRTLSVPEGALEPRSCSDCPEALRWANATWDVDVISRNASVAEVRLVSAPPNGTLLELPDYWNDKYRLWRSRLLASGPDNLTVEHLPDPRTALVGGRAYRVVPDPERAVADGNHPLARESLRFRLVLREVVFAGGGQFPPAPDATVFDMEGRGVNLSDLRGQPVLLDFYATWCLTCKQQAPVLARAREAFPDLVVLSVSVDPTDTPDKVRAFQREVGRASEATWGRPMDVNWTWAFDPTSGAAQSFSVAGIPREVLLDDEGRIRATSVGFHPWDALQREIGALNATG